jgi:hypothetical protein
MKNPPAYRLHGKWQNLESRYRSERISAANVERMRNPPVSMQTRWRAAIESNAASRPTRREVTNAERMLNPLAGAYAKRRCRTLRHGVKSALGMLARSACASMANG